MICGSEFSQQCLSTVCEEPDDGSGMIGYIYEAQTQSLLGVCQHPEFLLQLWHLTEADNKSEVLPSGRHPICLACVSCNITSLSFQALEGIRAEATAEETAAWAAHVLTLSLHFPTAGILTF